MTQRTETCPQASIRLAVIGMGQRTVYHGWDREILDLLARRPDRRVKIAALCDNRPERLENAEEKLAYLKLGAATYTDYRRMLSAEKPDAVYIATPNYLHREMTEECFRAGCHVLCEKPMATTLRDADAMIEAARASGKILALGMQMHYRNRYHRVAEIVSSGRIGQPVMVWCTEFRGPYSRIKDWVWDPEKSGGAIVEKNCHHTDILDMYVPGASPVRVCAVGGQKKYSEIYGIRSRIVDHAWVTWEYDSGAKGMIGISFVNGDIHRREFGVVGTEGLVTYHTDDNEIIHLLTNTGVREDITCPGVLRDGMFADFIDCVATGRQPLVTPELGRRSLLVPLAAEKSIVENRPVMVSELE